MSERRCSINDERSQALTSIRDSLLELADPWGRRKKVEGTYEEVVQAIIKGIAECVWKDYAIRIDEIVIDWTNVSIGDGMMMQVRHIDMRTRKY